MNHTLWKARARLVGPGIARNVAGKGASRRALLMYQVLPFRVADLPITHQNVPQMREIAHALADAGFAVDVVDHDERRRALLRRDYDLVVDLHPRNDPLYAGRLAKDAVRIAYITGADPETSALAERGRLDDLERRRGVRLAPRRDTPPFPAAALESCDGVFMLCGPWALATYTRFRLRGIHRLVNHGYDDVTPTAPERRRPNRFLFLGSTGQVHRGLDLLLELAAAEPGLELVVCSPFRAERDFVRAYRRELYETPNVRPLGFVPVRAPAFRDLQAECGALILPSCSEGQSGAVTAAMSYGLPVIASRECGFEEPEVTLLADCHPDTLRRAARAWAGQPAAGLSERSRATLERLRAAYRPAHYAAQLREGLGAVLAGRAAGGAR